MFYRVLSFMKQFYDKIGVLGLTVWWWNKHRADERSVNSRCWFPGMDFTWLFLWGKRVIFRAPRSSSDFSLLRVLHLMKYRIAVFLCFICGE